MGLLQRMAGGALKGVGEGMITGGKELRERQRIKLREESATERTQMGITSREKEGEATRGAATERLETEIEGRKTAAKVKGEGERYQDSEGYYYRDIEGVSTPVKTATGAHLRGPVSKKDPSKLSAADMLKQAMTYATTVDDEGNKVVDPTRLNQAMEAFKAGKSLPEPSGPPPRDPTKRIKGQTYEGASGPVVWDGTGFKRAE